MTMLLIDHRHKKMLFKIKIKSVRKIQQKTRRNEYGSKQSHSLFPVSTGVSSMPAVHYHDTHKPNWGAVLLSEVGLSS